MTPVWGETLDLGPSILDLGLALPGVQCIAACTSNALLLHIALHCIALHILCVLSVWCSVCGVGVCCDFIVPVERSLSRDNFDVLNDYY